MTDTSLLPDDYGKFTDYEKHCTQELINGRTAVAAMKDYSNPFGSAFLGWAKLCDYVVIIDRSSKWGNAYKVPPHPVNESVRLYEENLLGTTSLYDHIDELKGKLLLCWCKKPNKYRRGNEFLQPCHGDVLVRLANKDNPRGVEKLYD